MDPTTVQLTFVLLLIGVNVAIFVWFQGTEAAGSARRMLSMMTRIGLGRGTITSKDAHISAIMDETRRRCAKCPGEDLCDRWLAGNAGGSNDFCPNAAAFKSLA